MGLPSLACMTALFAVVAASATPASATPARTSSLSWTAPRGCPDAAALRTRVEHRLGRSLDDAPVAVEVVVTRSGARYIARLAHGGRTVTSTRCNELADAVAVIVARLAAEAIARSEAEHAAIEIHDHPAFVFPGSQGTSRGSADVSAEHVDRGAPAARPQTYVPPPWTLSARASAVTGIGVIPQVGLGGELAISVRAGTHLAELGAARWVASAAQFHNGAPAKIDVDLDVTVVRYGWRPAVLPLRAWVAVEGGTMTSGGGAIPGVSIESGRWIAAGAGFGIAWQMRPWIRLVGTTEVMVAVERVRFSVGDMSVYAPSPMSVRTTYGIELGWQ